MNAYLKAFGQEKKIPIISDEGLSFLLKAIKHHQVKSVLEIGTAIGYSAIMMSDYVDSIITLEKDESMVELANKHILERNLESKIKVVHTDAILYKPNQTFDLIFIDGPKAQYEKYFNHFSPYLSNKGIIICDNLNFHHLDKNKVSKKTKRLIEKLESFKLFLMNHEAFETKFTDEGDGLSLTRRKDAIFNDNL